MIEPIQGEAGIKTPKEGFLKELRRLCDQKNVLLIVDEIDKAPRDFPNDLLHEFDQLQFSVPELLDFKGESPATLARYEFPGGTEWR
jgi:MoxR-like ATPase